MLNATILHRAGSQLQQWAALMPPHGCRSTLIAAALLPRQWYSTSMPSSSSSSSSGGGGGVLQQLCQQAQFGRAALNQHCCSRLLPQLLRRASSASSSSSSSSSESAIEREIARREEAKRMRMRKAVQHEFRSPTLGLIWEQYRRPVPLLQAGVLPHPLKTFRFLYGKAKSYVMTLMAVQAAANNIPGHKDTKLVDDISRMYQQICGAQAKYQLDFIRDLVSKDQFRKLQLLMVQRQQGGWDKIDWSLEEPDKLADNIRLVQGRVCKSSQESPLEWLQLTYRIRSKQRFAAYRQVNKELQLVAGDPDKPIDVEDYWVFEYKSRAPVKKQKQHEPGARWRLVGRLTDV